MTEPRPKASPIDPDIAAGLAARISQALLKPIDPASQNLIAILADILRRRAAVGWYSRLSPETAMLVADALQAYGPKPDPQPASQSPVWRLSVDMYAQGSMIFRLDAKGELAEVVAWARSSLVAGAAYERLMQQYPAATLPAEAA